MARRRGRESVVSIEGLKELEDKLQRLDDKTQNEIGARAVEEAGEIVLKSARANAPVDTGRLRQGIHMVVVKAGRKGQRGWRAKVRTGTRDDMGIPMDDTSYYPASQEFGWNENPGQPYMRPAFHENKAKCIAVMQDEFAKRIEAAAKK
jgi:HK97 gp10 family phage protein